VNSLWLSLLHLLQLQLQMQFFSFPQNKENKTGFYFVRSPFIRTFVK